MKIHLTAISERGKTIEKSGNDFVSMEIRNEDRKIIAKIHIRHEKNDDIGLILSGMKSQQAFVAILQARCEHKNTEWRDEKGKSYLNCFDCGEVLDSKEHI